MQERRGTRGMYGVGRTVGLGRGSMIGGPYRREISNVTGPRTNPRFSPCIKHRDDSDIWALQDPTRKPAYTEYCRMQPQTQEMCAHRSPNPRQAWSAMSCKKCLFPETAVVNGGVWVKGPMQRPLIALAAPYRQPNRALFGSRSSPKGPRGRFRLHA